MKTRATSSIPEERHCTRQPLPRCPHCGHVNSHFDTDDIPLEDDETDTVDCEACEKYYEVTCNVRRTYSTRVTKSERERLCDELDAELEKLRSSDADKMTMPPEHDKRGNCLAESTVFGCPECSPNSCDVCHYHDEPRGECGECPACLECGGSDDATE